MENITLIINNEPMNVRVIRYFELNNSNYLIYSMNEVDDQNYVKLYAVKVESQNGQMVGSNIVDENEWNTIKELIKVIIKGNKDGVADVADLNYHELGSLRVGETRVFKLANQLVELLAANKKVQSEQPNVDLEPITVGQSVAPEMNVDSPTANVGFETTVETPTAQATFDSSMETPTTAQPTATENTNTVTEHNVEAEYYKNLYLKEKEKNEELVNKINEIKKIIGIV